MAALRERLARAETRLQAEPHDLDAWDVVLSVADNSPLAEGRPLYERFLAQFPCAVRAAAARAVCPPVSRERVRARRASAHARGPEALPRRTPVRRRSSGKRSSTPSSARANSPRLRRTSAGACVRARI
jgi:hypothetical protein